MKAHTLNFKTELKKMGKKTDSKITYTTNNSEIVLHDELFGVEPVVKANLLKSVMKELHIESSVDIEKETIVNYQLGILIGNSYEYINYGNYVVYSSEKNEDTNTYNIICYDKMLYSMKNYDEIVGTYPMTLKTYLNAVASKIGLTVKDTNFYNYALTIPNNLYKDLDYTYRDVLDELAQATGSFIIINNDDQIEVKYPSISEDTIDENYLKDINVKFGEKYGPVNSIVLSRAGESDNVYIQDATSVAQNGLCEIKIIDNQIMNFNNRSDFLQGLLNALNGTEYYLNDFSSIGILYYDVGDYYNISIGDTTYKCLMLNDEIQIKNGIQEFIHTDMPEEAETDYEKADKTDRRINQTYLIVDKQNQTIEGMINEVTEQNDKIAIITANVNELNSKISDIADVTKTGETSFAVLTMTGINESEPIYIKAHALPNAMISYLYPRNNLYPSDTLYITIRVIRFLNTTTHEYVDFQLKSDLLYYSDTVYDELIVDYANQEAYIRKKCEYNADGSISRVDIVSIDFHSDYIDIPYDPYPEIHLTDGDYEISLLSYSSGYLNVTLMASNIYTTQFATKVEVNTQISQTANEIDLSVEEKLTNYSTTNEMNSAINLKAGEITSTVSSTYETKDSAQTNYTQLQQTDSQISTTVGTKVGKDEVISRINQSSEAITINANKISLAGKTINLTSDNIAISSTNFTVDKNGNVIARGAQIITNDNASSTTIASGALMTKDNNGNKGVMINKQYVKFYSYNDSDNYIGCIGSSVGYGNAQTLGMYCDTGDSLSIGYIVDNTHAVSLLNIDSNEGEISIAKLKVYTVISSSQALLGYAVAGTNLDHKYNLAWNGSNLYFIVDGTVVGSISDKRLKREIKPIDENLIKAISECEIFEFIADNNGGKKSFGIIAQDLIESCKKNKIENIFDYNIIQNMKYKIDEDQEYYFIDYPQFLIAKNLYLEKKIEKQEKEIELIKKEIEKIKGGK